MKKIGGKVSDLFAICQNDWLSTQFGNPQHTYFGDGPVGQTKVLSDSWTAETLHEAILVVVASCSNYRPTKNTLFFEVGLISSVFPALLASDARMTMTTKGDWRSYSLAFLAYEFIYGNLHTICSHHEL